jgi:hypothetical protein
VNGPHRERCRFGVSMLCCAAPRRALFEDERILVTVHMIESQGAANGKWLQTGGRPRASKRSHERDTRARSSARVIGRQSARMVELSSRTFWNFVREFSSFQAARAATGERR